MGRLNCPHERLLNYRSSTRVLRLGEVWENVGGMNYRQKIQSRTRDPQFLWRMVIAILATGLLAGYVFGQDAPPATAARQTPSEYESKLQDTQKAALEGRWLDVWWACGSLVMRRVETTGPLALGLITGCCWLAFALQTLRIGSAFDKRIWLILLAIPLGALSVWPTWFFSFWQEYRWGLEESKSILGGLKYFIFGVGLREELAKLICLLPLMPVLLKWRSEFSALLASGCVGLGFATFENMSYFQRSGGGDAVGRYLTANPFHMTLTGLVGLATYRALRNPRDWGGQALATLAMAVFAHGVYNSFGAVAGLTDYGIVSIIVFALVVYQFFHELRELRPLGRETVSLTANFLCGVSLVTAITFVYMSTMFGWDSAIDLLIPEVLSMGIMVYLFLREMPESMIQV